MERAGAGVLRTAVETARKAKESPLTHQPGSENPVPGMTTVVRQEPFSLSASPGQAWNGGQDGGKSSLGVNTDRS